MTYEQARRHAVATAILQRQAISPGNAPHWTAEELMGYAHGLEDLAEEFKGAANQRRAQDEEAAWGRLMAL